MRKAILILAALSILAIAGVLLLRTTQGRAQARTPYETQPARRGDLQVTVGSNGVVRANQSTSLIWKTSGTVETVSVRQGDAVQEDQVLATLAQASLPQAVILARLDLVQAQRALDDLLRSQKGQAAARQAVEQAERLLEDAQNPALAQANARAALAGAKKAAEDAQRDLEIAQSPASPQAVESAYGVVLMWQNALERTRKEVERVQRKLEKDPDTYGPGESRDLYEAMLTSLTLQLVRYQRQAEDALGRYLRLTQPPDPEDVAVAQANLALAQAQLAQAQRDWEQVKDGTSPADLALLHAQLEDARRQAERLEAGADPEEVAAAQARVAAAEATLEMARQVAPFDGVITEIYALPADQVVPGDLAFRLDDLSKLLVELHISEVDINRIQTGQAVTLTLDSAPGSAYRGRVVEVSPVAEVQGGVAAFLVKAEIENADESIRPGMTAGAEIITAEFKDVLLVPASAVRMLQGQRVVYVLRDGKPEAVSVALGASSAGEVQVIEGDVQPGDAIVLNLEGLE